MIHDLLAFLHVDMLLYPKYRIVYLKIEIFIRQYLIENRFTSRT